MFQRPLPGRTELIRGGEVTVSGTTGHPAVTAARIGIEMRSDPRCHILQRCFVHLGTGPVTHPWQCIAFSISAGGVAVTCPVRLQEGTVLAVRAWNLPRACPLQARVVWARPVDFLWFTGARLLRRLTPAQLAVWTSGPLTWADGPRE